MKIRIILLISIFFMTFKSHAVPPFEKQVGFGPEIIYNLPLNGPGVGLRSHYHLNYHWVVSPQINYFPGIGRSVQELNLNLHAMFVVNPWSKWCLYATAGPYLNYWISYAKSSKENAKPINFAAELGAGVMKNSGCIRPFVEWRYNARWSESNVRVGFNYYPKICKEKKKCKTYS